MFWQKKKEKGLYYMLPGMNRGNRRKHKLFLRWSIFVGLLVGGIISLILYYLSRPQL